MHFRPNAEQLAEIAIGAARAARHLGHEPRVALLSHATFGDPMQTGAMRRCAMRWRCWISARWISNTTAR